MIAFIIALGVLILVHEWGHFIVARWNGIFVEEFSIGFGPKLIAKKVGETIYKISLLPLGGFVKMKGESPEEQKEGEPLAPDSFAAKKISQRLSVVLAGPFMNILFCFLLIPAALMVGVHEPDLTDGPAIVGQVMPDSPASLLGITSGDTVNAVQGRPVAGWMEFVEAVQKVGWLPVQLTVNREGKTLTVIMLANYDPGTRRHVIGIQRGGLSTTLKRYPPLEAIQNGFSEGLALTRMTFSIVGKLFTGEIGYKALSGPLGIAKASSTVAQKGLGDFLHFMAFLSLQLGILNLLPIPVLDGGHVLFMAIEAVCRKPLSARIRGAAQMVGVVLLLTLMLVVTINDANTFFGLKNWLAKLF